MANRVPKAVDDDVRRALARALDDGSFAPADGCRAIRALAGLSQRELAAQAGLDVKVVKALESGGGNPRLSSLERVADVLGLRVAFVRREVEVELFDPAERRRAEDRYRMADAQVVAEGRMSVRERDDSNAMAFGPSSYDLPELE